MIPAVLSFVLLAGWAGCGGSEGKKKPGAEKPDARNRDQDAPPPAEGEGDAGPVEGKDAAPEEPIEPPLPSREGINERWTVFPDCELADLKIADQQLYALCRGNKNRLVSCPLAQNLDSVSCENAVVFDDSPLLNGEPLSVIPLVHTMIDEAFSVVTFTTDPENVPGIILVDRVAKSVTEQEAFYSSGLRVGNDVIPFKPNLPQGAMVLGNHLLVATRNKNFESGDPEFFGGTLLNFPWMESGTIDATQDILSTFLNTNGKSPTLFLESADGQSARVLNNGPQAGFDFLSLDENGNPFIDEAQNFSLGEIVLEPLKSLPTNDDQSAVLLASGGSLLLIAPETQDISSATVAEAPIVAVQWYFQGAQPEAFVTDADLRVHRVLLNPGAAPVPSGSLPVYGRSAGPSALDPFAMLDPATFSGCLLYQGVLLERGQSTITAISCDVLERL